ncbi:hypothetical protein [Anaerospora sp.]|uniref:hypothetical protein n=1 Tax=Anaerospora sp. TaxID=1960278 RepID=UPI00289D0389|nr:hypothetical protein [Anaerospora sp.]
MSTWKLNFDSEESVASSTLISLFIEVEIKDVKMEDILDVDVLFLAIQEQGYLPLFTCSCGNFSCGGYYVKVSHLDGGICFSDRYKPVDNPSEADLIEPFECELSWKELYLVASEVYDKLIEISKSYPSYEIGCGAFGEDVLNKIDRYELLLKELRNRFND